MTIRFWIATALSSILFLPSSVPGAPIAPSLNPPPVIRGGAPAVQDFQWPMPAQNYAGTRFSPLDEISPQNTARLKMSWSFDLGTNREALAAPLVVGTTMYVIRPNVLYALDLSNSQGNRILKWTYKLPAPNGSNVITPAACVANDRVFLNTSDGVTIAVDAVTGQEIWKTPVTDMQMGETITMTPIVASGKVLVGNPGEEAGERGWLKALDVGSGHVVWTASDGAVLGSISYDPYLNLIYYGTATPEAGDTKLPAGGTWAGGVCAREPDTGNARWFHTWDPHHEFDQDGMSENLLVDLPLNRGIRRVLLHADRNGYVYVLDRKTGDAISATPIVKAATNESRQSAAYSPRTQLLYVPHRSSAMNPPDLAVNAEISPPPVSSGNDNKNLFTAWDPVAKKAVWSQEERSPIQSGALVTGGDVVFYGAKDGTLKALNARTGKTLWKWASEIVGQPMTYRGPDGKQYVAVLAGKKSCTLYAFALR